MTDRHDTAAEAVLPCDEDCVDVDDPVPCHTETCLAFYRPAVAALLREVEKESFDAGFKRGTQERNQP